MPEKEEYPDVVIDCYFAISNKEFYDGGDCRRAVSKYRGSYGNG